MDLGAIAPSILFWPFESVRFILFPQIHLIFWQSAHKSYKILTYLIRTAFFFFFTINKYYYFQFATMLSARPAIHTAAVWHAPYFYSYY